MADQVRRAWIQSGWWRRHPTWAVTLLIGTAVAGFSSLWTRGELLLDGRGIALYVRLASSYLSHLGRVPYWLPDIWTGSPVWALGPSFPLLLLVPLEGVIGADAAVKAATLLFQVVGGAGAFVLARSLWGNGAAPILAGLIYALHPMIISHGALLGVEAVLGVTAATPWLAWSYRKALRGEGTRFVVVSGLIAAFAVLHQAEYALALPLLCGIQLVVELSRPGDRRADARRGMLIRSAAVVGVGLAATAFWLLPLIALRDSFVLSPPELVQAELTGGAAATVSNEIGVFFARPAPLSGAVSYFRTGLFPQFFYVGLVCTALTLVSLVLLGRRRSEGDGHLAGILLASALGMWLSTGSTALADSGPALREQVVPLAVTGLGAGLLLGCFLSRVRLGRFRLIGLVVAAALLIALPFVTPFLTLQKVVPLFAVLRFPRFYLLAALGLSLGAAYPVSIFERWVRRRGDLWPHLPAVATVAVAVVVLIDILPFRSDYAVAEPPIGTAYRNASEALPATARLSRVATGRLEPGTATALIDNNWLLSDGWPHPVAGRQLWRITGETYFAPPGYRDAAFGLSATAYVAIEQRQNLGTAQETLTSVELVRNARALPLVRSYEQVVVVDDQDLAPLLATSLAYRNVSVVTRRGSLGNLLDGMPNVGVPFADPCAQGSLDDLQLIAGEVAMACAIDPWLRGLLKGTEGLALERLPGGLFTAQAGGLRGVSVWLDRPDTRAELALYEVGPDGLTLGPELARGQAVGTDEYGLTAFTFDPRPDSAGRRFAFVLSCGRCVGDEPRVIAATAEGDDGTLLDNGRLRTDRVMAAAPIYDRVAPATPPSTRISVSARSPGSWTVDFEASNPALLVVAETWFPGWVATIDGKSTKVLQADGAFLGVAVGAGRHVVELTYRRPVAADVGRVITMGTLLGLAYVGWRRRSRRTSI